MSPDRSDPMEKTITEVYKDIRGRIELVMDGFSTVGEVGDPHMLFKELVFCLFTPQSKARICWDAVEELHGSNLLLRGHAEDISNSIRKVRFRHTKAQRVTELRDRFGPPGGMVEFMEALRGARDPRKWIVDNVKGLGYKEASHFLRNVGMGDDLAILDRHILRNLARLGVLHDIPGTITPKKYIEIESMMRSYSAEKGIPMAHLDLVFWYMETGDIFK